MTRFSRFSSFLAGAAVCAVTCVGVPGAAAQQPTEAQRDAVRSACRSDYMAHCSSVTPGGIEALQCLEHNMSQLSGACRSAVNAIAAKPAAPAPAAAPSPPPAATPQKPAAAPPAAAPARPAAAPPAASPHPHTVKPSAAKPGAAASTPAAAPGADTAPPPPPPPLPLAEIPPRYELQIMRHCRYEVRTLCDLPVGGGRVLNCLAANQASVSAGCSDALDNARSAAR